MTVAAGVVMIVGIVGLFVAAVWWLLDMFDNAHAAPHRAISPLARTSGIVFLAGVVLGIIAGAVG